MMMPEMDDTVGDWTWMPLSISMVEDWRLGGGDLFQVCRPFFGRFLDDLDLLTECLSKLERPQHEVTANNHQGS